MAITTLPTIPTTPVSPEIFEALQAIVGAKGLITAPAEKQPFVTDWRGVLCGQAAVVVRPGSTDEVSAVVKLCAQHGVAIVPQGGNTGLMGGATPYPTHTGILLSLGRMNRVLAIDVAGSTMTVEAGVVLQTIQQLAAENDRLFPLSLGAQGSCMIGGNLSTNAGGAQVLYYGNTRNLVLGLEVVLPSGEIWNGLRALKKNNTGYDLKHLFVGAEGTLGIITKAVLRLFPKPKDVATAWVSIPTPQAGVDLLALANAASEDNVTSCELLNRISIDMVLQHIPNTQDPVKSPEMWYLLMEWSSTRPTNGRGMAGKMEEFLAEQMESGLVLDAVIAQNEAQARNMWHIRESHAEAGRADGPAVSYDMSVASSRIPEFVDRAVAAAHDILPAIRPTPGGHMGDGNLHFTFKAPVGMDKTAWGQYTPALTRAVNDIIRDFNGSISAEHGIGQDKIDELAYYAQAVELDTMRSIKRAFDPKNIMNPGKIFRM
jgi:FAD/FMN-containing dehydrogenase